jgi:hypothetical protein
MMAALSDATAFSYVLPVRMSAEESTVSLGAYLDELRRWCDDIIVVDGSSPAVFAANRRALGHRVRHVAVDPARRSLMGKVGGVLTGLDLARHERVVIADDDVRFDQDSLHRVVGLLSRYDLVRPQNYFSPLPWHALWDTARTLLNRAAGSDFPGTLGVRRSIVLEHGGYDGDVLFENLELIRTVRARGGRTVTPLDLFVRRLPPSATHFWGQRTRQAYDDFALPLRMTVWLSVAPAVAVCAARRRAMPMLAGTAVCVLAAEAGRRRDRGTTVFPAVSSLLAPLWVAERGLCAWLAVLQRLRFGGVRYGDSIIRVAANAPRTLRRGGARAAPRACPRSEIGAAGAFDAAQVP